VREMISQFTGAVVDHTRSYRFVLWRFWAASPRVLFIGLNPSTANEYHDDPTVHRLLAFAAKWGYGGIYLCNVFSYRAKCPETLSAVEAIHSANIPAIMMASKLTVMAIAAWGDGIEKVKNGKSVAEHIAKLVAPSFCFGLTRRGNPKHPLYLSSDAQLVDYDLRMSEWRKGKYSH